MKLQERLVITVVLLNHLYIVFLNTSSVHGILVPDKQIFTGLLVVALAALLYFYLKEPATTWYERSLYFAITLAFGASILRTFGISVQVLSYSIILVAIAILTTLPLVIHHHNQIRFALLGVYTLEIFLLMSRVFDIDNVVLVIGPLVELAVLLGIIYYNYSMGFAFDELFLVILASIIGWYLGDFIYSELDVPALIINTLFEQTISVNQYSIIDGIEPGFFLSLHIAEIFNILMVQFLTRRSWNAMWLIGAGLDMTYPPLMFARAILVLHFLRKTTKISNSPPLTHESNNELNSESDQSS